MTQFETLERDIAHMIAVEAVSSALEALGEFPEGGNSGNRVNPPKWALLEARDFLRRIEVANGGNLARALYLIGRGHDREFGVPRLGLPACCPSFILSTMAHR